MRIPDSLRSASRRSTPPVVLAIAIAPVVAAAVRAVAEHRVLLGDNAMIATRAFDVATRHHPLLGTWSSASVDAGVDLNHPGPLLFDLLAPFVKVLGMRVGVAIGMAALNGASLVIAVLVARRVAGLRTAAAVAVAALLLEFTVGSSMLVDPWNPHAMVIPFLALMVSAMGIALGDRASIVWFAALGSLCMQTHLGAVMVVPMVGVAAGVIRWRTAAAVGVHSWSAGRRWWLGAGALLIVLWAQPMAETALHGHDGNLARLAAAGGGGGQRIGLVDAARFVSAVLVQAPWSVRRSFMAAVPATGFAADGTLLPVVTRSAGGAALSIVFIVAVVAGAWMVAARSREALLRPLLALGAVSLVAAWLALALMPIGPFGLTAHQLRWLWPLCASFWAAIASTALHVVPAVRLGRRPAAVALVMVTASLAAASIPGYVQPAGPATQRTLEPVVADLLEQVRAADVRGRVLVDHEGTPLFDGTWDAVVATLVEGGVDVRVDDAALARHYGAGRLADGTEEQVIVVRWGSEAMDAPDGARRLALVDPQPGDATGRIAVYEVER